jgi:mono/diheme cytochrome c family protein
MNPPVRALLFGAVLLSTACAGEIGGQSPEEVERLRTELGVMAENTPERFLEGKSVYEATCAGCHGPAAGGTLNGPPLVHEFYKPSRHADVAFTLAVQRGVRAHHWRFGDMPPVDGVDRPAAELVVAYVRWLQRGMGVE